MINCTVLLPLRKTTEEILPVPNLIAYGESVCLLQTPQNVCQRAELIEPEVSANFLALSAPLSEMTYDFADGIQACYNSGN